MPSHDKNTSDLILANIHTFIEKEGLRTERIAEKMGMSLSSFTSYLKGQSPQATCTFATQMAQILGYSPTFFSDEHFSIPSDTECTHMSNRTLLLSISHNLTPSGKEGLEQIAKICDLIEIYK